MIVQGYEPIPVRTRVLYEDALMRYLGLPVPGPIERKAARQRAERLAATLKAERERAEYSGRP